MEIALARLRRGALPLAKSSQFVWNQIPTAYRASVLALLYEYEGQPSVFLTVRASHLRSYAGDVALPGGRAELGESPLDTALREGHEEVGLSPGSVQFVAQLPPYVSSKLSAVVPIVGVMDSPEFVNGVPRLTRPNPQEVSACFSLPLNYLLDPPHDRHAAKQVCWMGLQYQMHFYQVLPRTKRIGEPGRYHLWGLTANILLDIARLTLGQEPLIAHRRDGVYGDQLLSQKMVEHGLFGRNPKQVDFRKEFGCESPVINERIP